MKCKHSQTSYQIVLVGMVCKLVQKRARICLTVITEIFIPSSYIQLYGEKLEEVDQFKYIGATITRNGHIDYGKANYNME